MKACWNCHRDLIETATECFACGVAAPTVTEVRHTSELAKGAVISGRYELVRQLGAGGMGQVWLAQDCVREEPVAIKLLSRALSSDSEAAAAFKREANVSLKLTHPNIVRLINYEIHPFPYLLMEFVDGRNLYEEMASRGRGTPAPLALDEVARLMPPVADALDHAHRQNVQHRDIKPSNILLDGPLSRGAAKLADFGIAAELREGATAGVSGTPEFMAPEQLQRRPADRRADIYSLGVTIYNLLTGRLPFRTTAEVMTATPPPVPGLTMGQQYALSRALAIDPEARPASALELCARLGFISATMVAERATILPASSAAAAALAVAVEVPLALAAGGGAPVGGAGPASGPSRGFLSALAAASSASFSSFSMALRGAGPATPAGTYRSPLITPAPSDAPLASPPSTFRGEQADSSITLGRGPIASPPPEPEPPAHPFVPRGYSLVGANAQGRLECISPRDGAVMVLIPAGSYQMGAADGPEDERPVHAPTVGDYWMDRTPVTNRMFETFVRATGYVTTAEQAGKGFAYDGRRFTTAIKGATWRQPLGPTDSIAGHSDHPVVQVSWVDAQAYGAWAGRRLPTEIEWERAARGGAESKAFPWGDAPPQGRAWFIEANGRGVQRVGAHPANGFGLEDCAGNVWEWCEDWYEEGAYARRAAGLPTGNAPSRVRCLRGGAWYVSASQLRCSYRFKGDPLQANAAQGFRCALSVP